MSAVSDDSACMVLIGWTEDRTCTNKWAENPLCGERLLSQVVETDRHHVVSLTLKRRLCVTAGCVLQTWCQLRPGTGLEYNQAKAGLRCNVPGTCVHLDGQLCARSATRIQLEAARLYIC